MYWSDLKICGSLKTLGSKSGGAACRLVFRFFLCYEPRQTRSQRTQEMMEWDERASGKTALEHGNSFDDWGLLNSQSRPLA